MGLAPAQLSPPLRFLELSLVGTVSQCTRQLGSCTPALAISIEYSRDLRSPGVCLWLPPGPINYLPKEPWVELPIS
jgi:hypothetical protein